MPTSSTKLSRPRGRPRNADGSVTAERLVVSAASVCAERGFDGCTLARIATRADVHPTAIYNHFGSRDDLLYAVAVRALEQLTQVAADTSGSATFQAIAATYLQPAMAEPRQLLAEIHVASRRNQHLTELLAGWHVRWTEAMLPLMPASDDEPRATIQTLFMLLLGLCHVDQLTAVGAPRDAVVGRVAELVDTLVPDRPADPDRRRRRSRAECPDPSGETVDR